MRTYNIRTAGGDTFFCLDIGCQHARSKSYLATGGLNIWDRSDSQCLLMSYLHTEMARNLPPSLSFKCCSIPRVFNADGTTSTTIGLQETNLLFVGGQCFLEGGNI